jgi:hypothetical protein
MACFGRGPRDGAVWRKGYGFGVRTGRRASRSEVSDRDSVDVEPGPLRITARAWEDTGVTQPESPESLWNPRGYGNNAYAHITASAR